MILNFLFLTPIFIIGVICSYTDVKYGKIRNKWLAAGFIWVIVLYSSLLIYNLFFLHQGANSKYLMDMVLNGSIALVLGYILWSLKLWAAGDAKLFTLFAFLLPPEFYAKTYFSEFPSFVLLINIFVPLLLFLTIKALAFISGDIIGVVIKNGLKRFSLKKIVGGLTNQFLKNARLYANIIFVFIILQIFIKEVLSVTSGFTSQFSKFYLFLIIFFLFRVFNNFISRHKMISFSLAALGLLSSVYMVLSSQTALLLDSLKMIIIFLVLVGLLRRILSIYIEQKEIKIVKSEDVGAGMSLSLRGLGEDIKKGLGFLGKGGLSEDQAALIRKFPGQEIRVYKIFALAPFIFLGTALTVLTRDSCLNLLSKVFYLLF